MQKIKWLFFSITLLLLVKTNAQPVMETGGQKMPNEWIDQSTGHKIVRLTRMPGSSMSFYFHNNPFIGNKMVFYNSSLEQPGAVTDMRIQDRT
jgi:oligogalacturonide lyase